MSTVRCVYHPKDGVPQEPPFPATDQHPDAVRYLVGLYYVDAIGGEPTLAELQAVIDPPKTSAPAMLGRQRAQAQDELDAAIAALPASQQSAFRLIQQLLKE